MERGAACLIDGQQVAVFRLGESDLAAVGNHDPYSRANVISRGITGTVGGRWFVASPMYKNRFDLRTGACLEDASVRLPVYQVRVENGQVYLAVPVG